jgi:hypothetical protein
MQMDIGDTIELGDTTYSVNETRPGEANTLRIPSDARRYLDVSSGDVISNSRLNRIFDSSIVSHTINSSNLNNSTVLKENFQIFAHKSNETEVNITLNGKHIKTISGSFKNDSQYTVSDNGNIIGMFNGKNIKNNETLKFYSGNNVIELSFDDSMNETTSSQFLSSNKNSFIEFYTN